MVKSLKIATWNANGLAKRLQESKTFIFSQNMDILLVCKTHFTNKSYCRVPRYTLYHTMHSDSKTHGGTALIIRNNIKYYDIDKFQRKFLQTTNIVIKDQNVLLSGCITISATYLSSKHAIKKK